MALAALVPPEKNEGLIYVVPGFAIAFYLVSQFWNPEPSNATLTNQLAIIGILASAITIFLYILKIDEWLIKSYIRKRTKSHWETSIEWLYLAGNILVKTWEINLEDTSPLKDERNHPYLKDQAWTYIQNMVSSSSIRQRYWSLRLLFYSWFCLLGLIITGSLSDGLSNFDMNIEIFSSIYSTLIFYGLAIIALVLMILQAIYRNTGGESPYPWKRNSRITRDTAFLAELSYLYALIAMDSIENADEYIAGKKLHSIKSELDFLIDTIIRNDWSLFSDRWNKVKVSIIRQVIEGFDHTVKDYGWNLWSDFIRNKELDPSTERRKLCWFTYFTSQLLDTDEISTPQSTTSKPSTPSSTSLSGSPKSPKSTIPPKDTQHVDKIVESIIDTLRKHYDDDPRLEGALDIREFLKTRPDKLMGHDNSDYRFIIQVARALGIPFHVTAPGTAMKHVLTCIRDSSAPGPRPELSRFVMEYSKELYSQGLNPQIWSQMETPYFGSLYGQLTHENDRFFILRDFTKNGEPGYIDEIVANGQWNNDILTDQETIFNLKTRIEKSANLMSNSIELLKKHKLN